MYIFKQPSIYQYNPFQTGAGRQGWAPITLVLIDFTSSQQVAGFYLSINISQNISISSLIDSNLLC